MERKLDIITNGKSYNCYSGSVCYILKNMGTFLSEPTSFGLSGGLGIIFNCKDAISFSCVREKHCLTEYIESLGVRVAELQIVDFLWLKNYILMSIGKNEPVMLRYDGYYLPYTPIYNKKHDIRIGLVTGYDDGVYYMTDFVYDVVNYKVTEEDLEKAVFSKECEKEGFETFLVTAPTDLMMKISKQDVNNVILECTNFFLDSKSTAEVMLGLDGIKRFAENAPKYSERLVNQEDWDKVIVDLKQMSIAIKNYALFFREIKEIGLTDLDDAVIEKIFQSFVEASKQWDYFCNCITVYKITKNVGYIKKIKSVLISFEENMRNTFCILRTNINS